MKLYRELTRRGRLRRLRGLAGWALAAYGLADARLSFIRHGENAIYRVDAPGSAGSTDEDGSYSGNRYALQIHVMDDEDAIASELMWLRAERGGGPACARARADAGWRAPGPDRHTGNPAREDRYAAALAGWAAP